MLSARLGWTGTQGAALHPAWRDAATIAPPEVQGLVARQWQLERTSVQGWYLFEDERGLETFLADPSVDAAYARLALHAGTACIESLRVERPAITHHLKRPIFLIAAPRSGSTLLFDLLAQAPGLWTQGCEGQGAVDGIVALHPAHRGYASDRLTDVDVTPDVEDCLHAGWRFGLRDREGKRFDELAEAERPTAPRLLDKTTEHSLRVAFLARACPDARFIFLHRDARQCVSSLMQAWRHGGFVRMHELPDWPQPGWCFLLPPDWRELRGRSLQTVATAQWEAAHRWAMHDLETLDQNCWTSVDYNELVAHPHHVMERLCAFLGLEFDARLAARVAPPLAVSGTAISPPSAIKWRSNGELDVALLEAATRATSARLRSLHRPHGEPGPTPPAATTAQSAVRFACHLADVATDAAAAGVETLPDELLVEPGFRFQRGASVPLCLATTTRFRERFLSDQPILWTRDLLTQAYRPFWVERHQVVLFDEFEPGAPVPPCAPALRAQLHGAGIVATRSERAEALRDVAATRARLGCEFAERGYCVVSGLLAPSHTRSLARYYRELVASGLWAAGDEQVARRHGWHNESVARFFHHQLTSFVAALVGEPVCASYTYVSAYQRGAELTPHIDRRQCEYTLSLIIDERGGRSTDWPLWFLAGTERSAVALDVGEGVLFRGHDLPHWREAPPQPDLALSTLLLHYVPAGFGETLH